MSLHITLYQALTEANVPPERAQTVVKALDEAIDDRYALHAKTLVTQGDLKAVENALRAEIAGVRTEIATAKNDMLRWIFTMQVTSLGIMVGAIAAAVRFLQP